MRRESDRTAPPGSLAYGAAPSLPGVLTIRVDNFIKDFYLHLDVFLAVLILRSEGSVRYRRRSYGPLPGRVYLGEPGELVETNCRQRPEVVRCLMIRPEEFRALSQEFGHPGGGVSMDVPHTDDPGASRRLLRLHQALESQASPLEVQSRYLVAMRAIVGRLSASPAAEAPRGRETAAVRCACRALEERLSENVTLDELAALAGLPRLRFFRAFQRSMGLPPHEYQLQRRMAAARSRLARQEAVIDVAFDLGFADQAHFTRHFTRIHGVPPKAFSRSFAPTWSVPV
jgi:AraC-like DNA-binding protein